MTALNQRFQRAGKESQDPLHLKSTRQKESETNRGKGKKERKKERKGERETNRQRERQSDRESDRERDREIDRQRDRQRERQIERQPTTIEKETHIVDHKREE